MEFLNGFIAAMGAAIAVFIVQFLTKGRFESLEAAVGGLQVEVRQIRSEVGSIRSEMATKAELESVRAEVGSIRSEMATKADLEPIRAEIHAIRSEMATMRSDLTQVALAVAPRPRRTSN